MIPLAEGWALGHSYVLGHDIERTVTQGGNHYLALPGQLAELTTLGSVVATIGRSIFPLVSWGLWAGFLGPIGAISALSVCAIIAHGHFTPAANYVNSKLKNPYIPIQLPAGLSSTAVRVAHFFTNHANHLLLVAMIASTVALFALGHYAIGAGIVVAIAYHVFDIYGFIPHKISLYMEKYVIPLVTDVGMLLGNSWLFKIFGVCDLPTRIIPYFRRQSQYLFEDVLRWWCSTPKELPTLREFESSTPIPLLSKHAMVGIIESDSSEINPAHCSTIVDEKVYLQEAKDFDRFLAMFNAIDWKQKSSLIVPKLFQDEKFIEEIHKKFPNDTILLEFLRNEFPDRHDDFTDDDVQTAVLKHFAQINGQSSEDYVVQIARSRLEELVEILTLRKRVVGSQVILEDAITDCSHILFYLNQMTPNDQEDILLKLAIEAGSYCSQGIQRVTREIVTENLESFVRNFLKKPQTQESLSPGHSYERQILQAFESLRKEIVDGYYQVVTKQYSTTITSDVHLYNQILSRLGLGFLPLRALRNDIGLVDLLHREAFFVQERDSIYNNYKMRFTPYYDNGKIVDLIDNLVNKLGGTVKMTEYLCSDEFRAHTELHSSEELFEFINELFENSALYDMSSEIINRQLFKLVLVGLGILKLPSGS